MQCVILAAGRGTRLHPVSRHRSKAMAPVAGKPMVGHVIDMMVRVGIDRFVLVTGPDDAPLADYVECMRAGGLSVDTVVQPERMGMAHALSLAVPHITTEDFVLSACDNLVADQHVESLIQTHRTRKAAATLSLMRIEPARVSATGIVDWQNERVTGIVEKPRPEDAPSDISSLPLYVLNRRLLDLLPAVVPSPRGEYELQDAIQVLIERRCLVTGVFTEDRRQLTDIDDLLGLNRYFLAQTGAMTIHGSARIGASVVLNAPLRIDAGVTIGAGCTIGPNVYLELGATIECGATIRDAVVLTGGIVPRKYSASNTIVV